MKKLLILFCAMLFFSAKVDAQLFKKLKDKAEKAITSKPEKKTESNEKESGIEDKVNNNDDNNNAKKQRTVWEPTANCNKVFTLTEDEKLLYDETKVFTKDNKASYGFVIVNKRYEYFLIEDNVRTGPFKESPVKSMKAAEEDEDSNDNDDDKVSNGNDNKDAVTLQYSKTIGGKLFIVFNGKNFGPYDYISKIITSPDKKKFFAMVTSGADNAMMAKMGMGNIFMVNEQGLKQKAGAGMSMGMKFKVSPGFKHCVGTVMDQKDQKVFSVTSTGKREESSMTDIYAGNGDFSMVSDAGDIISVPAQSPTQLMVNGEEAAAFKVPIKNIERLFILPDPKKSVYYSKGKLYKADGTEETLTGIIFPKVLTINNVTSIYYYKIHLNENNTKDVYLCTKAF